ncbi:MAG: hypothetical protein HY779_04700, partial [Rubrobacteridae bacterium]|nr:hypothetical protein [Rubrobacteridae bacterium]
FEAKEFFSDFLSRHFTYYINNVALTLFTFIILGATVIPAILKMYGIVEIKYGPEFYNRLAEPLGLLYLILITVCPFMGWQKTDVKTLLKQLALPAAVAVAAAVPIYSAFWRYVVIDFSNVSAIWTSLINIAGFVTPIFAVFSFVGVLELFFLSANTRAKNQEVGFITALGRMFKHNRSTAGGYMSHLGMAVMFFGIVGSMIYVQELSVSVPNKPGNATQIKNSMFDSGYDLVYKGYNEDQTNVESKLTSTFELKDRSSGKVLRTIDPSIIIHKLQENRQTVNASIHYELFRDVFVVLNSLDDKGNLSMTIKVNPLISFVWAGSTILVIGILIAMWPKKRESEPVAKKSAKPAGKKKKAAVGA